MSEDSLEPLVTQCPNCDTRFRVTESQLQVAQGRVRCGACLSVFDGTAHLSLDGEEFEAGETPADVDALLEELDEISGSDQARVSKMPEIEEHALDPVSQQTLVDEDAQLPDDGEDVALPDELLALEAQLLDELRDAQADEQEEALEADELTTDEPTKPTIGETAEPEIAEPEIAEPEAIEAETAEADATLAQTEEIELHPLQPEVQPPVVAPTLYSELEVEEEPESRRSWLTMVLILLALIGLPAQVLWFQYESWVKDPDIRPLYQALCDVAGCKLPPMRDVSLIVSKKSIIRAHPDRKDARIVDVLMVNNADFAQPYPLIELMATTIRGQLVAGRRFKPDEYLQGELAGAELFPPHTPVHVSLEIQDPGEDALNFEVRFR